MPTDQELLRCYIQERSEKAFTELVRRHVNLVYGAALRQLCGNAALAEDVTQSVFTKLAAKADTLSRTPHLSSWIYTTTRFTVSHTVRAERRRQTREQKAQFMNALLAESDSNDVPHVPPDLIDEALEELNEADRDAILLRFFEAQSFAGIGVGLGLSEDAVRMRVARALEKIRIIFARKGITSSAAAVGAALANQAIAAPVSLAANAAVAALADTATVSAKLGIISLMATSKTTVSLAVAAAIIPLGYLGYQYRETEIQNRRTEIPALTQERNNLQAALKLSEQREVKSGERADQAERKVADLQRKAEKNPVPKPVRPPEPSALNAKQLANAARMAEMKPLLEAGMPIKGAIITHFDGKPVQRPVEFVMGKEIRIEGMDDGTYIITPTLNQDGSVKYGMVLSRKSDGGQEQRLILPAVTQTPWGRFMISVKDGAVMAFDPDKDTP